MISFSSAEKEFDWIFLGASIFNVGKMNQRIRNKFSYKNELKYKKSFRNLDFGELTMNKTRV